MVIPEFKNSKVQIPEKKQIFKIWAENQVQWQKLSGINTQYNEIG